MVKILEFEKYDENDNVLKVKVPVTVTLSAIMKFERHTGKTLTQVSDSMEDVFVLLYYAYLAGVKASKSKGYKVAYDNLDDFEEVFDGVGTEFLDILPEFFNSVDKKKQGKKK